MTIPYERPHEFCELTVAAEGTLRTSWFETESCCDKLVVDGAAYSGPVGPNVTDLSVGSTLLWRTDFTVPSSGWTVCLDKGVSYWFSELVQSVVSLALSELSCLNALNG